MTSLERPPASTSGRQVTDAGDILELTYDKLDSETIIKSVQDNGAGAVAVFIGTTRDTFEGRIVTRLTYEAYSSLCLKTFASIAKSARELPSEPSRIHAVAPSGNSGTPSAPASERIIKIGIHHRLGEVPVGDASIVIAVSSPHRRKAFEACEFILEEVKKKAQVWKREWYATDGPEDGKSANSTWKENFSPCCNHPATKTDR